MSLSKQIIDRNFSYDDMAEAVELILTNGVIEFVNCSFEDIDLAERSVEDKTFSKCKFKNGNLKSATLENCVFKNCQMPSCEFRYSRIENVIFDTCNCIGINLAEATASGLKIIGSKFTGSTLRNLRSLDLEIKQSIFDSADLSGLYLKGQNLQGTNFSNANLEGCDLSGCSFDDCILLDATFSRAKFQNADLRGADLGNLSLSQAARDLKGAIISKTQAATFLQDFGLRVM